jgi:hypothetical protein
MYMLQHHHQQNMPSEQQIISINKQTYIDKLPVPHTLILTGSVPAIDTATKPPQKCSKTSTPTT